MKPIKLSSIVGNDYSYALTTYYDGNLVHTLRTTELLEAVDAWSRCNDYAFANEYATYNLTDPMGKMYTKTFYRNGEVSIK